MSAKAVQRPILMERALRLARIGYFSYDIEADRYDASPEAVFFYNLPSAQGASRADILAAIHPDDRETQQLTLTDIARNPRDYEISYRVRNADGVWITVHVIADVSIDEHGRIFTFGTVQDITQSTKARSFAQLNEQRLHDFADAASDWFWESNEDHRLIFVSERFEALTGLPMSSILGTCRIDPAVKVEGDYGWDRHLADILAHRPFRDFKTWTNSELAGSGRLISYSGVPVLDEAGQFLGYRGVGRDVTDDFLDHQKLGFLALHDELTGLLNRRAFQDKVESVRSGRRGRPSFLALLDLDRFKYVNDNFGHACGDQLLVAVAETLCDWLPAASHVARLSGDEFAIALSGIDDPIEAGDLLGAILLKLCEPCQINGVAVQRRASIGFTRLHDSGFDRALLEADVAKADAKSKGGGIAEFFDQKKQIAADRRQSMERELRAALERDEFSLMFQPQIDLGTSRLIGGEALLRWRAGSKNEVSPFEFIPVAEDIGLMPEIGRWVLRQSVRQLRLWLDHGLEGIRVAINVSAKQFVHDDLCALLMDAVTVENVPAHSVELEITESVFLQDQDLVANAMRRLRQLGISIALDDFGTGYSSLSYLRSFPVDRLKIDRSFIRPITEDESARAIVEGIVRLAQSLNIEVVAEGVEHTDHASMLRELGCQTAQGYHYAKPLSVAEFTEFARRCPAEQSQLESLLI